MTAKCDAIIAQGKPWSDSEFPADKEMICKAAENPAPHYANWLKPENVWKKASEIYPGCKLFSNEIDPNDIG